MKMKSGGAYNTTDIFFEEKKKAKNQMLTICIVYMCTSLQIHVSCACELERERERPSKGISSKYPRAG